MKKILIFSISTIPFDKDTFVDGAGMRSWFLATGLKENNIDVTIAIPEEVECPKKEVSGIKIVNWKLNNDFMKFTNSFDSVLLQYTRPDITNFIADQLDESIQLIVDLYIPAYIEVSARNSDEKDSELRHFLYDVNNNWNKIIQKGNIFIYANKNQEYFYEGVLSALGRLNPITYSEDFLIKIPLGVQEESYDIDKSISRIKDNLVPKDSFVIMWFGSLYPWFDIKDLIEGISIAAKENPKIKLIIVGAKNPKNTRKEFIKQYEDITSYVESREDLKKVIIFQDWINYSERFEWFNDVDLFVSINKIGRENKYSWRTRSTDLIAAEKPMLTNGGDPIGEMLINKKAAFKLESLDKKTIAKQIKRIYEEKDILEESTKNLIKIKENLSPKKVLAPLIEKIEEQYMSPDLEKIKAIKSDQDDISVKEGLIKKFIRKVFK